MNDEMNAPMSPVPNGPTPFYQIWINALTKPSEQTFADMASSPNAKSTTAFLWVFLGSLVQFFFASLVQNAYMRQLMQQYNVGGGSLGEGVGTRLITAVCGAPIAALISVVFFAIFVGVIQLVAKMFSGRGTFDQMAYTFAAIAAPFAVVSSILTLLAAIPLVGLCFGIVSLVASIYVLVLEVMAVKGVNQFGWGQAVGSFLLPFIVLCCCLSVGVIGILRVLGPRISDTFNQINQGLTP
jgi:Flp pilus assembly pilin Flp